MQARDSAKADRQVRDPVCGMMVERDAARAKGYVITHNGVEHAFCSARCHVRFVAEPDKYLAADSAGTAPSRDARAGLYTLPHASADQAQRPGPLSDLRRNTGAARSGGTESTTASIATCGAASGCRWRLRCRSSSLPWRARLAISIHSCRRWQRRKLDRVRAVCRRVSLNGKRPVLRNGWQGAISGRANMFTLIRARRRRLVRLQRDGPIIPSIVSDGRGRDVVRGRRSIRGRFHHRHAGADGTGCSSCAPALESGAPLFVPALDLGAENRAPQDCGWCSEDVPLSAVRVGDLLLVRPGETVPTDGVVVEGASAVDESLLTGEAFPVEKNAGADVTGGTLNGEGALTIEARRVGADTMLSRIVALVAEAQRSRAPTQGLADAVASVVRAAGRSDYRRCLGRVVGRSGPAPSFELRTSRRCIGADHRVSLRARPGDFPMSMMAAIGRSRRAGILVRDAQSLERLARADVLVVDKTNAHGRTAESGRDPGGSRRGEN